MADVFLSCAVEVGTAICRQGFFASLMAAYACSTPTLESAAARTTRLSFTAEATDLMSSVSAFSF
jgi:hypothetical protein